MEMKRKNFTFCLAVFLLILLTTAMLYFYITRRLRREQCDTVPDPCRPAVAITFDDIYRNSTTDIKSGDVIIFHDDNRQTVRALDDILTVLEQKGFQFVTLSQLREIKK